MVGKAGTAMIPPGAARPASTRAVPTGGGTQRMGGAHDASLGRSPSAGARRKRPSHLEVASDDEAGVQDVNTPPSSANHNKYCHFCQHVKVRASSMLACSNSECSRRFCEHCLLTHLAEDVDPVSSDAWVVISGKKLWQCPICRKRCCCSVSNCAATHRHCKAYRYRRRRAELASKRLTNPAGAPAAPPGGSTDVGGVANEREIVKRPRKGPSTPKTQIARANASGHATSLGAPDEELDEHDMGSCLEAGGRGVDGADIGACGRGGGGGRGRVPAAGRGARGRGGAQGKMRVPSKAEMQKKDYDLGLSLDMDDDDDRPNPAHFMADHSPFSTSCPPKSRAARGGGESHRFKAGSDSLRFMGGSMDMASSHPGTGWPDERYLPACEQDMEGTYRGEDEGGQLMSELMGPAHVIYGHMDMSELHELENVDLMFSNNDDGATGTEDFDEALWLRRTYETVYNPQARKRALEHLAGSASKSGARGNEGSQSPSSSSTNGSTNGSTSTNGTISGSMAQSASASSRLPARPLGLHGDKPWGSSSSGPIPAPEAATAHSRVGGAAVAMPRFASQAKGLALAAVRGELAIRGAAQAAGGQISRERSPHTRVPYGGGPGLVGEGAGCGDAKFSQGDRDEQKDAVGIDAGGSEGAMRSSTSPGQEPMPPHHNKRCTVVYEVV